MNIFDTMTALFSGERVSHTDTFILAGVVLALFIGIRALSRRIQNKDLIEARHLPLAEVFTKPTLTSFTPSLTLMGGRFVSKH